MAKCYRVDPSKAVVPTILVTPAGESRSQTDWKQLPFPSVRVGDASVGRHWGFMGLCSQLRKLKHVAFAKVCQGEKRLYLGAGGMDGQAIALVTGFDVVTRTEQYDIECPEAYREKSGGLCTRCGGRLHDGKHLSALRQEYYKLKEIFSFNELEEGDQAVVIESGEDADYCDERVIWFRLPCSIRLRHDGVEWRLDWDGHFLRRWGQRH